MTTLLENLKLYFDTNSREQIETDWADLAKYDEIGLKVDDFWECCKLSYEPDPKDSYWEYSCSNQIIENPKFASGFFFTLVLQKIERVNGQSSIFTRKIPV
jgi:hypothetical protein